MLWSTERHCSVTALCYNINQMLRELKGEMPGEATLYVITHGGNSIDSIEYLYI